MARVGRLEPPRGVPSAVWPGLPVRAGDMAASEAPLLEGPRAAETHRAARPARAARVRARPAVPALVGALALQAPRVRAEARLRAVHRAAAEAVVLPRERAVPAA